MSERSAIPPRSNAQENIIGLLLMNKTMRFTELQKGLHLSRPAISRHLAMLLKQEIIEFTKSGREKHYQLKGFTKSSLEKKVMAFSAHYAQDFLINLDERREREKVLSKAYEEISANMGSYFLYLILKSLDTGENWFGGFESSRIAVITMNYLLALLFKTETAPITALTPYTKEQLDTIFKDMHKIIISEKKKTQLEKFIESLEKLYPKEVQRMKNIEKHFLNEID